MGIYPVTWDWGGVLVRVQVSPSGSLLARPHSPTLWESPKLLAKGWLPPSFRDLTPPMRQVGLGLGPHLSHPLNSGHLGAPVCPLQPWSPTLAPT